MIRGRFGASRADVVRLFDGGSVAGLGDGELLERFALSRDEAAFEALVAKLGPMVLGVCRRMLADSHDVDDAFQATFLVLVRRAGSIRDRDLVGPWLHGVATRVAKRARAESIRRAVRERVAVVTEALDESTGSESDGLEVRALIDEEIDRLPEHHRRLVILCDVEGLTREEAALRLGWSLNMVRGRLERARDRLRGRLTRRGLTPSGGYLALLAGSPHLSPALISTTSRTALAFGVGRLGLATASAVALFEGVSKMMLLSKLKVGLAVLLSTGFVAGTGILAAQGPSGKQDPSKLAAVVAPSPVVQDPARATDPFQPRSLAQLANLRVEAAMLRYKTQLDFYEQGRITIDRLTQASQGLMQAEVLAQQTEAGRIAAVRAHYERIKEILKKEEAELETGRATTSDVFEIKTALLDAEYALATALEGTDAKAAENALKVGTSPTVDPNQTPRTRLAAERVEIAQRIYNQASKLFPAEITIEDYGNAWKSLLEAKEKAATTKAERVEAIRSQVELLKRMIPAMEALQKQGLKKLADLDQLRLRVIEAETNLIEVSEGSDDAIKGVMPGAPGALPTTKPADGAATGRQSDELVAMALKNYEAIFDETVESIVSPKDVGPADNQLKHYLNRPKAELLYLWSRRCLDAQRDRSNGAKADEVAAIDGHRVRMEALEKGKILVACAKRHGKDIPQDHLEAAIRDIPEFQAAIKFYRLEAESWLAKAR